MQVSFQQILEAFQFSSMGGVGEHQAFLCMQTGKTYWRSEFTDLEEELDEPLPDDIEDDDKYVAIPDKKELGLGKPLALSFVREILPNDFDEVRYIFSKRGAYRKFRALLELRRAVDKWYDFEAKATERALREWCELNSIELSD